MNIYTNTEDINRFNAQQNMDDNSNIQYENRNCDTFLLSCRMSLPGTAEFIATRNWYKVPLPNGCWEGSNDHNDKALHIAWKCKDVCRLLGSPLQPDTLTYEGESQQLLQMAFTKIAMEMFLS